MKHLTLLGAVLLTALAGCATTSVQRGHRHAGGAAALPPPPAKPYSIQVVQLGLSENVIRQWPDLRDKKIGFGLSNRIVEGLYDTGWFRFLEEKDEIVTRIVEQWDKVINRDDLYRPKELDTLETPDFLVYGEIYEFSVGSEESVVGIAGSASKVTRIGIQLRFAEVASGEFVPASGLGEEWVEEDVRVLFIQTKRDFSSSAIGRATDMAVDQAVAKLLPRIARRAPR